MISKKKKKKVFAKIQIDFSAKIRNSKVFSSQKSGDLKKKKKVFAKIQSGFTAEIRNSKVFSSQNQVISRKKKKKVSAKIQSDFSSNFANSDVWGGLFSYGGAIFHFFQKIGLKSTKKHAILHTSQANGGGSSPLPPLATLLGAPNFG